MYFCLKDFVEGNSVEKNDIGIDHLVNLQSRFSMCFPEAVSDKYKWITDPFHAHSLQNNEFSLLKKRTVLTLYLILPQKFSFLGNHAWKFEWALGGGGSLAVVEKL
jgi:hypothetical protein